jgi:hypothetical protein
MTSTQRLARALVALQAATDALDASAARNWDPRTAADAARAHDALCQLAYSSDKDSPNRRDYDRYLHICRWMAKRSAQPDGSIVTHTKGNQPSRYTLICEAAFQRYITTEHRT